MAGLTKEQFEELDKWVSETDVSGIELETEDIDGIFAYQEKVKKAIFRLKHGGWGGYFEYADDQDETELTQRAIVYLLMKQSFRMMEKKDEAD